MTAISSTPRFLRVLAAVASAAAASASAQPATNEVTVGGFYEFTGAYTRAQPTHGSRAVSRLQLAAGGRTGAAKWQIAGRVDADPVYGSGSFYLPAVRDDQKFDLSWRETYVDLPWGGWDWRLGAQQVVWGEVVGLFFADVVSARDLRDFLLPGFDVIRKPQWAIRAERFDGDSKVEFVLIPRETFDDVGKPGSDFYPATIDSPATAAQTSAFRDPVKPDRSLRNAAFGARATTLVSGWDLAAFYYRSFATNPTFYRVPGGAPGLPFALEPRYDRTWQLGGTASKDLGGWVARAELVYTKGRAYSSTDPTAAEGVLRRNTVDWVAGTDIVMPGDVELNVQVFQRWYDGGQKTLAVQSGNFGSSVQLVAKLTPSVDARVLWIRSFGGGGSLVRPRLDWQPGKNIKLGLGADVFSGPRDGFFGRYDNRDRVYTELRVDF